MCISLLLRPADSPDLELTGDVVDVVLIEPQCSILQQLLPAASLLTALGWGWRASLVSVSQAWLAGWLWSPREWVRVCSEPHFAWISVWGKADWPEPGKGRDTAMEGFGDFAGLQKPREADFLSSALRPQKAA